jgi:hypothetical protein
LLTHWYHMRHSDRQLEASALNRRDWHGDWNYTLRPKGYNQAAGAPDPFDRPSPTWPGSATRR